MHVVHSDSFRSVLVLGIHTLVGPLHTRAKIRDLEVVRAQKKMSEGRIKTPPKIM